MEERKVRRLIRLISLAALQLLAFGVQAETFSNISGSVVDFPLGAVSFADELVDFSPGLVFDPDRGVITPLPEYLDGTNTLGAPDVTLEQAVACSINPSTETCRFVSLGQAGSLTVKFVDNFLTGSDDSAADLYIFEAGPQDEIFIDISADSINWVELGAFASLTAGVDLDGFGFGRQDLFSYVRLRDNPDVGQIQGDTLGADIDAIGAISTVLVPLPGAAWLMLSALVTLLLRRSASRTRA